MKRSPLKRSTKPLKRTQLKRVSKKMAKAYETYRQRRKDFLAEHPFCEVEIVVPGVLSCMGASCDVHHINKRGPYLNDTSTWLAVCRECHTFIHNNPKIARELGLLK